MTFSRPTRFPFLTCTAIAKILHAMVMDRLSGSVDVSFATSEEERVDVVLQYLSFLPRIYKIHLEEARAAGFTIPESPEEIAVNLPLSKPATTSA